MKIKSGEIFGLIGPNGSGKTTTISILLGLLNPDSGAELTIYGQKVPENLEKLYPKIGFMPQDISLYTDISIEENLKFYADLNLIPKKEIKTRIEEVLNLVDLLEFRNRVVAKCSGGMQRRASLAVALLHRPSLLILDEPTVGIDPELRNKFWDYFRDLAKKGTTILITTHYLAESERCNRVAFINKNIKVVGTPIELKERAKTEQNLTNTPDMEEVFIYYTQKAQKEHKLAAAQEGL